MTSPSLLSMVIFLPTLAVPVVLALSGRPRLCRWTTLLATGAVLLLVLSLFFQPGGGVLQPGWQLSERLAWLPRFGISYDLRCDGISLMLLLLTGVLSLLAVLVSWRSVRQGVALFHAALLFTETAVLGVFLAADLFLFYLFWELQLLPIFLIIGRWGHEGRIRAAVQFLLFSIAGSLFMLIALITLYLAHGSATGDYTFALIDLVHTQLDPSLGSWLFAAFALAFAIKIPLVPLHAWLPDAHTEAPTAGSVILAGLLLKTGAYGLLRLGVPLFPAAAAAAAPLLMVLGVAGLGYSAWIALAQSDMKRLVAYSSIGHMGLVVLGIAAWNTIALTGSLLQMVNHALTTGALFIMVGMLDERLGTRKLAEVGGLWHSMPRFSGLFLLFALSSLGLPGLNNFVGEILILFGIFRAWPLIAVFAFGGLVLTLVYVLHFVQEVLFGPPLEGRILDDLSSRETLILLPLALAVVVLGVFPQPLLKLLAGPVQLLLTGTR